MSIVITPTGGPEEKTWFHETNDNNNNNAFSEADLFIKEVLDKPWQEFTNSYPLTGWSNEFNNNLSKEILEKWTILLKNLSKEIDWDKKLKLLRKELERFFEHMHLSQLWIDLIWVIDNELGVDIKERIIDILEPNKD